MYKKGKPLLSPLSCIFYIVMLLSTFIMLGLSFLIIVGFLTTYDTNNITYFCFCCWGITLLLLLIDILIINHIITTPKREQLRYYKKAGLKVLSLRQRQALQLTSVLMYSDGFWSETLEYYPLKKRVKHDNYIYRSLPLIEAKVYQDIVYSDWGVKTKLDYTTTLNQLWRGMHSEHFLDIMNNDKDYAAELVINLAELVKVPEHYITNCIKQIGNRPPTLLWGFDLWRAIMLSRNCFCVDIISEEQAWQDILKTASHVYGFFGSHEDFITNYRLGNAFWSNSIDMANERLAAYKLYQEKCYWPIKSVPWPDVVVRIKSYSNPF